MSKVVLALDYGEVRTGVALYDGVQTQPLQTLEQKDLWSELKVLCNKYKPSEIVVGLPRNLDGNDTAQTALARDFAQKVSSLTKVKVHLQDEATSSERAMQNIPKNTNIKNIKKIIDQYSAQVILEDYLNKT